MDEGSWELLRILLSQSHPGLSIKDVEVLDVVQEGGSGPAHFLIDVNGSRLHIWTVDGKNFSLDRLQGESLLSKIMDRSLLFKEGKVFKTEMEDELRYQRFGPWTPNILEPLEDPNNRPKIVREDGDVTVRVDAGGRRYSFSMRTSSLKGPKGELTLSRLNSTGFVDCPTLLGMCYWDNGSEPLSWMNFTSSRTGSGSGFKPFLSDLRSIMKEFHPLGEEKARRYLIELSRNDHFDSLVAARRIGKVLGDLHGMVMLDTKVKPSAGKGVGSRIAQLFSPDKFSTGDVGSILGLTSYYMSELRKDFIKVLGDRQRVNPESGRKMKVLKSSRSTLEGVDVFDLGLFRESFLKREATMRKKFSSIRDLVGSPVVPIGVDSRLDRMEYLDTGDFLIERFDWEFFGAEKGELEKFVPLKDLAMVLNSLNKARYLASRQMIKGIASDFRIDERSLVSLFLEYNLAKVGYNRMMKDFNLFRAVAARNVPFRHVFSVSVVGALWFERMRNGVVNGYTEKLQSMKKTAMLDYPKKVDTVEATDAIRSILGLSNTLTILERGKVASMIGLESELMNAICYLDQP